MRLLTFSNGREDDAAVVLPWCTTRLLLRREVDDKDNNQDHNGDNDK
jgi:hypothetical protein